MTTKQNCSNCRLLLEALHDLLDQLDGIGIPDWRGAEGLSEVQARATIAKVENSS